MRDWLKKRRKRLLSIILLLVGLGLIYWLVLAAPINKFIRFNQLADANAKWQVSGITHYRIVFDLGIPLVTLRTRFSMMVKNGQIEKVESKGMVSLLDPHYNPDTVPYTPVTDDSIKLLGLTSRTVEETYLSAAYEIDRSDVLNYWYDIEYDPQFHYVSLVQEHCYGAIGDCGFYYRVIEFEALP